MADTPLASLSLTHVHYNPRDPLSYLSAWLALLPQGLCIVYTTLLISTREIEIAFAFAGQLCCEALNWMLKRLIKEQRPEKVRVLGKGYGMPSSHSQFVGFWSVYVALWLWIRFSPKRKVGGQPDPMRRMLDAGRGSREVEDGEVTSPTSKKSKEKDREKKERKEKDKDKEREKDKDRDKEKDREKDKDRGDKDDEKEGKKHKRRKSGDAEAEATSSPVTPTKADKSSEHLSITVNSSPHSSITPSPTSSPLPPASPVSPAYALQLHHPHLTKAFLSLILFTNAFFVCVSRIYLSYHTARQVYIGYAIGAIFASIWFVVTELARRWGYVDLLLDHPLLRLYRVRDLCCEEDLVELGWGVWEEKRKRRRKFRKSVRFAGGTKDDEDGKKDKSKKSEDGKKRKKKEG